MPDRAVVDDPCFRMCRHTPHDLRDACEAMCWDAQRKPSACPSCGYPSENRIADSCFYCEGHELEIWPNGRPEPAPRALVALSEDQKWLVRYHMDTLVWVIYDECHWGYQEHASVADTGQSAEDVLQTFLSERGT